MTELENLKHLVWFVYELYQLPILRAILQINVVLGLCTTSEAPMG